MKTNVEGEEEVEMSAKGSKGTKYVYGLKQVLNEPIYQANLVWNFKIVGQSQTIMHFSKSSALNLKTGETGEISNDAK